MTVTEKYRQDQRQEEYDLFCNRMDRVLHKKVTNELIETGRFTDDDIGDDRFVEAVELVKDSLYKTLWDSYNDDSIIMLLRRKYDY